MEKLKQTGAESQLSIREKSVLAIIQSRPGIQSGEIAEKLTIPLPMLKRILSNLYKQELIKKLGSGRGINYTII